MDNQRIFTPQNLLKTKSEKKYYKILGKIISKK